MDRNEKQEFVSSLRNSLEGKKLVVVTQQAGLTVAEVTSLRAKMREAGANYKVIKNTLARLAVQDTPIAPLGDHFKGAVALAFSDDPIAAAKIAVEFAKTNKKIQIVAACLDGKLLDAASVDALAKLPSLNELRATLIGLLQAPLSKIARTVIEPAAQLARLAAAYSTKE
ncbi:MAG: 50S ribosomal protein L10 [Alphaproteobacteria bacterium]|uniref:Large ribosomal subunit protein uL10 n=1 Tax=Candidatus Bodocaedibacter vickermanii TaxID=2741701 RepID=A0A7L9RRS9_9PROT|nr:50S ribosomal protein L10 [Alphaproteobacteria bacterium]QOL19317.1 50S ribosomal protein L10 [Candidatus Paracaedibacteraceae bacterium 'Lake Konstanz']